MMDDWWDKISGYCFAVVLPVLLWFIFGVFLHQCSRTAEARTAEWPPVIPPALEEAFTAAGQIANLDPLLLAAWSYTETEWNPYALGSRGSTEKGLFHMRDKARIDVGCIDHDPYDRFQDAICAAMYLRLVIHRCQSTKRGLSYVKTGYCWPIRKGSAAERVLRIRAEIARYRAFAAWDRHD